MPKTPTAITLPRHSAVKLKGDTFKTLKDIHEKPIKSPWVGNNDQVTPYLLPLQFGDGKEKVGMSFSSYPSICVLVLFDSNLPLDLPMEERCERSETIRCFRDALDEIYEGCMDIYLPEEKEKQILGSADCDPEDFEAWREITRDGCVWC